MVCDFLPMTEMRLSLFRIAIENCLDIRFCFMKGLIFLFESLVRTEDVLDFLEGGSFPFEEQGHAAVVRGGRRFMEDAANVMGLSLPRKTSEQECATSFILSVNPNFFLCGPIFFVCGSNFVFWASRLRWPRDVCRASLNILSAL